MNMYSQVVENKDIRRTNKMTLLALVNFTDRTGRRDPSLLALSDATGLTVRYVRKQLKDMVDDGLIKIERHRNLEGRLTNHYDITLPEAEAA